LRPTPSRRTLLKIGHIPGEHVSITPALFTSISRRGRVFNRTVGATRRPPCCLRRPLPQTRPRPPPQPRVPAAYANPGIKVPSSQPRCSTKSLESELVNPCNLNLL